MKRQQPIKILFLGNYLSRLRGTISPTEILAKHLDSAGVSAKLVSQREAKLPRAAEILLEILFTRSKIVCADVFSGNVFSILPWVGRIAAFRGKKLVLVLHGGRLPEIFEEKPQEVSKVLSQACCLLTPSLFLKHFFEGHGFMLQCIPNPVQLRHFPYFPNSTVGRPKLLWVRAFADIYRPELAVDTLVELRRTYPDACLTMIGPDAGTLFRTRAYIAKLGLSDAVRIEGPVPNEKLAGFHQSHTLFLNTTAFESFGCAVLEAAASGIPIVSAAVGNIPLFWEDDQEILLAKTADAAGFAARARQILSDSARGAQLSKNARKKAEQFDIEHIIPEWQRLFREILP